MRIAFGLVYFGLCLGKYEYLHGALHRATFSPPPKKAPAQKSSGSIIMIYDDWIHFSSSCSPFQSAIHWKVSWLGPRGRQFDPEMSSRWRLPRLERHRKLRLVLKQWVSRKLLLIFSFLHNRRDLFHFYFFSSCYFFSCIHSSFRITSRLLVWNFTMLTDKKVINNEHFVQRGNELTINNAFELLSGNYSCVVEFLNSGAKLRTPHELINIVGEYLLTRMSYHNRCLLYVNIFPLKLLRWTSLEKNLKLKLRKISLTQSTSSKRFILFMILIPVRQLHGCLAQHKIAVELHNFHGSTVKRKST